MKIIFIALYGFCCVITASSRLIESVKERTLPTDTKTVSSPPLRLARQIDLSREYDGLPGTSEEDRIYSDELRRAQKKREGKYYNRPRSVLPKLTRFPRGSGEHADRSGAKNSTATTHNPVAHSRPKQKPVNKKPIPKYNEMDYDDDFQMKVNKSPIKVIDSGEHEDEDFNLNDYDFDVNHDEFIGRGKPLEPRMKHKEMRDNYTLRPEPKTAASENKHKSKPQQPTQHKSSKKERSADNIKKTGDKEDYFDDNASTVKPKTAEKDGELNEENDESKEFEPKSVRVIRSPTKKHSNRVNSNIEKYGEKRSMAKILSILPMFPELPARQNEYNIGVGYAWSAPNKY